MIDNQTIYFVTKHEKEHIVAPSFFDAFRSKVVGLEVDTDILGTFSGERERELDPLSNARKKIDLAMLETSNAKYFLASEGSFVPHPEAPWITLNEECLLFYDKETQLSIHVFEYSNEVHFKRKSIDSATEIKEVIDSFDFPNHGIIIKLSKEGSQKYIKEISTDSELETVLLMAFGEGWLVEVESDLRAHRNPTRRKVIRKAGERLVEELKLTCPKCASIGQIIKKRIEGVQCANCGIPSRQVKSYLRSCYFCQHEWEQDLKNPPIDPQFCSWCNP
jgi:hypothetical protein